MTDQERDELSKTPFIVWAYDMPENEVVQFINDEANSLMIPYTIMLIMN